MAVRAIAAKATATRLGLARRMTGKNRFSRWLIGAALLAAVDFVGLATLELAVSSPAQAQFYRDDRAATLWFRSHPRRRSRVLD